MLHDRPWHCLGASAAYNLLRKGGPQKLWMEMTNRAERDDLSEVLRVQMGIHTEPLNRRWYCQETGFDTLGREVEYTHRDHEWLVAHPDDMRFADDGSLVVIDYKHTSDQMLEHRLLQNYTAQIHIQAACACSATGHDTKIGELSVFFGNGRWRRFEIPIADDYTAALLKLYQNFHRCLIEDRPPDPASMDVPDQPPPPVPYLETDMSLDNAWAENAATYIRTKLAASEHKNADRALKDRIGDDVRIATGHGIAITQTAKRRTIKILESSDDE